MLSLRPLWTLNKLGSNIRVGVARTDANFVPILYPSELSSAALSCPNLPELSQSDLS